MPHPPKNGGTRWKIGLALLVGVFLVAMAFSFVIAAQRVSRVVDADYYTHGLHYGQSENGSQGWTITAGVSGAWLRAQVTDPAGTPVAGGRLRLELQDRPGSPASAPLELAQTSPGVFQLPRPFPERGELRGTLRFTRGEAGLSRRLVLLD